MDIYRYIPVPVLVHIAAESVLLGDTRQVEAAACHQRRGVHRAAHAGQHGGARVDPTEALPDL